VGRLTETVAEDELITQKPAFRSFQNVVQESFTAATLGGGTSTDY